MSDDRNLGAPIDGVVASEIRDTQGEVLDVKGADISDLVSGKGYWNSDHRNNFTDIVGRITFAKKIFNIDDCENDRQRYFYNKLKSPIIYASGYIFDQDGEHENAKAVAAILRNQARTDSPLKLKASVEGGVIERGKDTRHLKRTKISRVALTFVPANQNTLIETPQLQKNAIPGDMELVKSLVPFAKMDAPSFIEVAGALSSIESLRKRIEQINGMAKALTAGLSKAKMGRNAHAYNLGTTQADGSKVRGLSGEDAKKAQIHAVKTIANDTYASIHRPYKTMQNLQTGKPELHVLLHHGVDHSTGDETGTGHLPKPKGYHSSSEGNEHNIFSIKNGIVDHPVYGVHTWTHDVANQYTGSSEDEDDEANRPKGKKGKPGIHSFWVPVSSIHATRNYENARFKNPNQKLPKDFNTENENRQSISHDPQAEEEGHISVRPGKFHQASKQDLQDIHDKIETFRSKHKNTKDPEISRQLSWLESPLEQGKKTFTKDGIVVGSKGKSDVGKKHEDLIESERSKAQKVNEGKRQIERHSDFNHLRDMGIDRKDFDNLYGSDQDKYQEIHAELKRRGIHPETVKQYNLNKALTAGFGGGSPTDSTGGQVLQTESMENVGKNIDCPSCGKKQLYASYQIKCRECHKAFPFHVLAKLFVSKDK